MRQKLWSITQILKLPSICRLCNQFHKGKFPVCQFCIGLFTPLKNSCQYCAYPLPEVKHLICGTCIKNPPHFDKTFIAWQFEEPLRGLIHQFKYHKGLYLAPMLSHIMKEALPNSMDKPECLIPVPMHPARIKQRGFNQSAILAKLLAKQLKLPCDLNSCKKMKNTAPQASLDAEQRQKNLQKAFLVKPLPYQHIMLIDDLFTTGSTVNELALVLKKSGVKRVDICCCARVLLGK